jgi:uncharacterized membrane protein
MASLAKHNSSFNKWGIFFSMIGVLDAGYLSWITATNNIEKCVPGFGNCSAVNLSKYSRIWGIPVAYIGLSAYIVILLLFMIKIDSASRNNIGHYLSFGITLTGFLFSIYLTYVQFGLLNTYCPFCLLSALITTILFAISTIVLIRDIY